MTRSPRDRDESAAAYPTWRRYLRFWGTRVDADVDDEIAFHTEMRAHDYLARGMSEQDARAAALSRLGDVGAARDACVTIGQRRLRRATRARLVDAFIQDIRFGARMLARAPGWTIIAVLTLGLGIGSTTAMFGVVNSLLLHPIPYRDVDRVVTVWRVDHKVGEMLISGAPDGGRAWEQGATALEGLEPYGAANMTLTGRGDASTVRVGLMRSSFLAFTGLKTVLGRGFSPDEDRSGRTNVALLSEQLWRSQYGSARDILGKSIVLDDKSYTIVGVTEAATRLPTLNDAQPAVWVPVNADSMSWGLAIMARLRPGASKAAAEKELAAILNRITPGGGDFAAKLTNPVETASFRGSLVLLSAAVGMLMLVACANVAHLLLARGATRQRELAIRGALGAGRGRLARQLLTENSLLAAAGCSIGIGFGYATLRVLVAARPATFNQLALAQLDGRALAVAVALSLATAVVFGCAAALHAIRRTSPEALRTTSQSDGATRHSHRLRSFLIVTEMALSAMLLVGTTLVTRSVMNLQHVNPGFDAKNVYSFPVRLPQGRYPSPQEREAFANAVLDRVKMVPGIETATIGNAAPPKTGGYMMSQIEGDGIVEKDSPGFLAYNNVADDYFRVLQIPILSGTVFSVGSGARHEVVVSQGLAKQLWHGQAAVGRRIRFAAAGRSAPWFIVIGVVGDVTFRGLSDDKSEPFIYHPLDHEYWPSTVTIVVRARPDVDPSNALRPIVRTLDNRLTPPPIRTMDAQLAETIGSQRFTMTLLAAFAGLAVVLSAIGLYGVISYVVTQRTREIGIRVALGATPAHVAHVIVAGGLILSTLGLAVGLGASVWGTKLIRGFLYGIEATDPASYLAAGLLLLVVCLLACAIPLRRAVAIDPTIAMRGD